jgi:hypothetical protein
MRPPKEGCGVVPTGPAESIGRDSASVGHGLADDRNVGRFVALAAVRGGREIGGIGLREQPIERQGGCQAAELAGGGIGERARHPDIETRLQGAGGGALVA